MRYNYYLSFIVFLILIFFGIITLSLSTSGLHVNYNIKNEISLGDNVNKYTNINLVIGDVLINNEYFLPKKVKLKKLVLCEFINNNQVKSSDFNRDYFYVNYLNSNYDFSSEVLFSSDSYNYFEVRANMQKSLKIVTNINLGSYDTNLLNKSYLYMYLFEINDSQDSYNFCNIADKDNAMNLIKLNFN